MAAKNPDPSELKVALDNRTFELQLFWQRSNYFLVLMTALGIGTFSVKDTYISPIVASFSVLCSFLWFKTNLGSKFWQESWEAEVSILAREEGIRSFERPTADVIAQVKESLSGGHSKRSLIRRWVDGQIAKKPSVTYHMILLSLFSTAVWALVAAIFWIRLVDHVCQTYRICPICWPH